MSPVTRAGNTLTIFKKENGKWLLARDANGKRVFDAGSHALAALIAKHVYPTESADKAVALVENSTFYVDPQGRLDVGDIYKQVAWYKGERLVDPPVDA